MTRYGLPGNGVGSTTWRFLLIRRRMDVPGHFKLVDTAIVVATASV